MSISATSKVEVLTPNKPGSSSMVNAQKYHEVRRCIELLDETPRTFAKLHQDIQEHLDQSLFPNGEKSMWWCKTVQLDMEARGVLHRLNNKPLEWRLKK